MKRNKIYMMCMILAGILFFGSVGAIVRICMSYREGEQVYEELEEYIREPESSKEPEVEKSSEENSAFTFLQVDFESLQSINPEVIAWIQIPGIGVDYPVVQGEDNEYYLYHTFQKENNKAGSIFLDYRNHDDFTDRRVILYGHNMKDGSMFSNLKQYQDSVFRKNSGSAYLYLPEKILHLEITACEKVSMRDDIYALEDDVSCDWPEEIILSTCSSSSDMRLILRFKITRVLHLKSDEDTSQM